MMPEHGEKRSEVLEFDDVTNVQLQYGFYVSSWPKKCLVAQMTRRHKTYFETGYNTDEYAEDQDCTAKQKRHTDENAEDQEHTRT